MNTKERLEAAGWKSGTVAELLGLSEKEADAIEQRIELERRSLIPETQNGKIEVNSDRHICQNQNQT